MTDNKLNIFILSNDDLTSSLIFSEILKNPIVNLIGVAYDQKLTKNQSGKIKGALSLLKKISFFYWFYLVFTNVFFKLFEFKLQYLSKLIFSKKPLPSLKIYCKKNQVPLYYLENFSSPYFKSILKEKKPDLVLIRISQIIDSELLSIPKFGTWCIHSSLLPSYKGIAAEFHAINQDEAQLGSSIFMVSERLDEGVVLAQTQISIDYNKSVFFHMIQNNIQAGQLLNNYLSEFYRTQKMVKKLIYPEPKSSYFSWPTSKQFKVFKKNGRSLIFFKEIFHLLYSLIY